MSSELRPPDGDRPAPSRARTAVENLLPAGIVRRSSARPPATPHMERSISSMADSFVDYWGQCSRNAPDVDGAKTPEMVASKEDGLTPISNWAHLNYMKTQRNTLRAELKVQQVAGAEAKRSVASLRRLAFRMAVNISVKERQIATSARNLAKSRKSKYLEGRDAEKRVEELKRSLRVEEGRNREILEALERASMLTLQYANPTERPRNMLSPPPSPPVRQSNLSMTALNAPRTPPRSTSSSWNDTDWELTPGLASPTEIRTSDSRLIRAKRESDQALAACRQRINDLQEECARGKEVGETLEASKVTLEKEIGEHQASIASLEEARTKIEEILESTKLQLEVSTGLEDGLKQMLRSKIKELNSLQQGNEDRQKEIESLQKEKSDLTAQLEGRSTQLRELESRTAVLEENLKTLQNKLETAVRNESSLHGQLKDKDSADEELRKRLDRGSKYEQILQKKIAEHEQEILGNVKKIEVGGGLISSLREQIKQIEGNKHNTEQALSTLRVELSSLESSRRTDAEERSGLAAELSSVQSAKSKFEEELSATKKTLDQETTDKTRLQSERDALLASRDDLHDKVQDAERRIQLLERMGEESQSKFELLRDDMASIEADLKDARQTVFSLREKERMNESELVELRTSEEGLQQKLHESEEHVSVLEIELNDAREAQAKADHQRAEETRQQTEQHRELQLSMTSLQATLAASEKLKTSLQEELERFQSSKADVQNQLNDTLRSKTDLQTELDSVRSNLEHTTSEGGLLRTRVNELENELNTSRTSHADIEARLTSLHDERDSLKTLVSELELALSDSRNAQSKVEESLRVVHLDDEASGAKVADLHDRLNEVQESKEDVESKLRDTASARSDLESQLQAAQSRLVELEAAESKAQSELSHLRDEMMEAQHAKAEAEQHLQTAQSAQDELKVQLQSTQWRLQAVESDAEELRSKLAASKAELETSRSEMTNVETKLKDVQNTHAHLEEELATTRRKTTELESELTSNQSRLMDFEMNNSRTTAELADKDEELSSLRQNKSDAESKLSAALITTATLKKELESARYSLQDFESQHASLTARIASTDQELADFREQRYVDGKQSSVQNLLDRQILESLNSEKVGLIAEAQKAEQEIITLRDTNAELEEAVRQASQHAPGFESELHAARVRLETTETETVALNAKIMESNKKVVDLSQANSNLTESQKHLSERLASAEEELQTVQETNKRLEAFLERVEQDMAQADKAIAESEKRLGEFVEESQAKLDAARNAKLKYKRRLSEKTNEIGVLLGENMQLHDQVGELAEDKKELEGQLTEKESFVNEVKSSSDKRQRSMNSAYNELRAKYEKQLREQQEDSSKRLEHELQKKNSMIDGLRQDNGDSNTSFKALEQEVNALREDKKAFERLVRELKEKVRHLETLEEWREPVEEVESPSRASPESIASTSPSTHHTGSSRPGSSIGHPSYERPQTRASTASKQEDLDAWAREIERIRMRRDEQAVQLRDNKKARSDLRKSLKDSEKQLHQLEKQNKSYVFQSPPLLVALANTIQKPSAPQAYQEEPSGHTRRSSSQHTWRTSSFHRRPRSRSNHLRTHNSFAPADRNGNVVALARHEYREVKAHNPLLARYNGHARAPEYVVPGICNERKTEHPESQTLVDTA